VPPETACVDLFRYGEALAGPKKMDLSYAPKHLPGRFLEVSQPERIDSVIRIKDLAMDNAAIDAKARAGPPQKQHPMLCARIGTGPCLYGAGLPYGRGKLYKYRGRWTSLVQGERPQSPGAWQDWSFRVFGDELQFAVGGDVLAEVRDKELTRGAIGARVWNTSLYLDDIRVRKFTLPEPVARVMTPR